MVTITGYTARENSDGETFYVLHLQGEIEMVRSQDTGRLYATARQTTITSTFDEATCQRMVGTELPGVIRREETEPYEYTIPETGEVVTLSHTWTYDPEGGEGSYAAGSAGDHPHLWGRGGFTPNGLSVNDRRH